MPWMIWHRWEQYLAAQSLHFPQSGNVVAYEHEPNANRKEPRSRSGGLLAWHDKTTDQTMGLTYSFTFSANASVTAAELERLLKSVEADAKQLGFDPTLVFRATFVIRKS